MDDQPPTKSEKDGTMLTDDEKMLETRMTSAGVDTMSQSRRFDGDNNFGIPTPSPRQVSIPQGIWDCLDTLHNIRLIHTITREVVRNVSIILYMPNLPY